MLTHITCIYRIPDCSVSISCDDNVIVCDAVCLERNLNLVLQILEITSKVVVCVNLIDEATKKGIKIDTKTLSKILKVPIVETSARGKKGLDSLLEEIINIKTLAFNLPEFNALSTEIVNETTLKVSYEYSDEDDVAQEIYVVLLKDGNVVALACAEGEFIQPKKVLL